MRSSGPSLGLLPDVPEVLMTENFGVSSADAREPAPMRILLPAIPASLAVIRAHLSRWLPTAAVNASAAAEVLLAVGEAASNAVEHAVRGAARNVVVEVTARATDTGLALTVKDNGRWHAPPPSPQGHRGHGSRLMRALVDTVTITPTPHGTTVEMRKELKA
ncbi:ATP-binding protein [Mycobacterium sp. JS623]|uniref:ATP-binding protein n=1 Tax=Mycobacterium sp. JS623 TaxID=212767 RepID=UPI00031D7C03|nr:ATP-binding protein [Mycobacterium sp. JS623]